MKRVIKPNRLIAICLVVTAWLTSLCLFMPPSHACCPEGKATVHKVLPPCCMGASVTQVQPELTGYNPPELWLGTALFEHQALLNTQQATLEQSRNDLVYVPDQSNRYLELRVLLN